MMHLSGKKTAGILCASVMTVALFSTVCGALELWPNINPTVTKQTISALAENGKPYHFSADDLEQKLGLKSGNLEAITITSLPPAEMGVLLLDGVAVTEYQELTREEVNRLTFLPSAEGDQAEFSFIPKCAETAKATMAIQVSDTVNCKPVVQDTECDTLVNIPVAGTIPVYDKEGDRVMAEVLTAPVKGEVAFNGLMYTYTPFAGQTGADSFQVAVKDEAGNYSDQATVSVYVAQNTSSFTYTDMGSNPSHYSAIRLCETGILCGEKRGGSYFFHPTEQVSRGDFLIGILSALQIDTAKSATVNTGLTNDGAIATWMKPYVKLGIEKGIITEDHFNADEKITRAEAAVMTDRAAAIPKVNGYNVCFQDIKDIPQWALQSYINLSAYRMLDIYDGNARPNDVLTKDSSADLLWQLYKYQQKHLILE